MGVHYNHTRTEIRSWPVRDTRKEILAMYESVTEAINSVKLLIIGQY